MASPESIRVRAQILAEQEVVQRALLCYYLPLIDPNVPWIALLFQPATTHTKNPPVEANGRESMRSASSDAQKRSIRNLVVNLAQQDLLEPRNPPL